MTLMKIDELTPEHIASICDHTFLYRSESYKKTVVKGESPVRLRQAAFEAFLKKTAAGKLQPYAICVRPEDVKATIAFLKEAKKEQIRVASVVGFPDGSNYTTDFKVAETILAITHGAKEIDMVLDYDRLMAGRFADVSADIKKVVAAAHERKAIVKVILETSELDKEHVQKACQLCTEAHADFVKTSTGFSASGANAENLTIMRQHFPGGVKMSSGVNKENVNELLHAISGRPDGYIELDPTKIRIGESSLLSKISDY
ncbi:MAG: deoxyribose-phosphate aldolase [archaeon]